MTKFETVFIAAQTRSWAGRIGGATATVLTLASVSGAAAAQPGITVPAQVFGQSQASARPIGEWRPDVASRDPSQSAGQTRFLVNVPVGAGASAPVSMRLDWAAPVRDVASAAADRDDEFIRDAWGR